MGLCNIADTSVAIFVTIIASSNPSLSCSTVKMKISVKEPGSGTEFQLNLKIVVLDQQQAWSVTLPEGQVVLFSLQGGKWMTRTDGKIGQEFSTAIGHILDLLSKHERPGEDIEACYRIHRLGNGSIQL